MKLPVVSVRGVKVSGGMDSSRKIFSLNFWNVCRGSSVCSLTFLFSMPQNYLGLYFSMSGSVNCICARPSLHACTYCFRALVVCLWSFPLFFTAVLYRARAARHRAVNHGARCLAHLFGLWDVRLVVLFMTPALSASLIKKASILDDLRSFYSAYVCIIVWNASANSGVAVCFFHFTALVPYSFKQVPSIHR